MRKERSNRIEPDTFKTPDESVSAPQTVTPFVLTPSMVKDLSSITDNISDIRFATMQLKTDTSRIEGWIINLHSSIMEVGNECDYLEKLILEQQKVMKGMHKRLERLETKLRIMEGDANVNGARKPTSYSSGVYSSGKNKQLVRIPDESSSL